MTGVEVVFLLAVVWLCLASAVGRRLADCPYCDGPVARDAAYWGQAVETAHGVAHRGCEVDWAARELEDAQTRGLA